jgi:hypothetical protein
MKVNELDSLYEDDFAVEPMKGTSATRRPKGNIIIVNDKELL